MLGIKLEDRRNEDQATEYKRSLTRNITPRKGKEKVDK